MSADDLDRALPREDNAAMLKKSAKLKHNGRSGKPSRSDGQGRAVTKGKASPSRNGRGQKRKDDDTPLKHKPKQAPGAGSPPQPSTTPIQPLASPAPAELPPKPLEQRIEELLRKLTALAYEYQSVTLDDMSANRQALHPELRYTARLLQANVLATDLGDHEWLRAHAATAETYLAEHRASQRSTKHGLILHFSTRPEAVRHLKRFVIQTLKESSEEGRWPYHVIQIVSNRLAEVMVGNLIGDGAIELAWELLPELRQNLADDASTRSRVANEILQILESAMLSDIEERSEAIVRRVLSVLGYKRTKDLFGVEQKARAAQKAGQGARRDARTTQVADQTPADMQATAETSGSVPPSKRNA